MSIWQLSQRRLAVRFSDCNFLITVSNVASISKLYKLRRFPRYAFKDVSL